MGSVLRHAAGFLVAPLAVPALLLPWAVLREASRDAPPGYVASIVRDSVVTVVTEVTPIAYGLSLAFGIPLLLALRAVGRATGPWTVGVAAGLGGLFTAAVLHAATVGSQWWVLVVGAGAVCGGAVSAIHCLVAGIPWRRAAPSAPPPTSRTAS